MVNYARIGRSQRKLWWRLEAVLTCKSIVEFGYRGERPIEPSTAGWLRGAWLPSPSLWGDTVKLRESPKGSATKRTRKRVRGLVNDPGCGNNAGHEPRRNGQSAAKS